MDEDKSGVSIFFATFHNAFGRFRADKRHEANLFKKKHRISQGRIKSFRPGSTMYDDFPILPISTEIF